MVRRYVFKSRLMQPESAGAREPQIADSVTQFGELDGWWLILR
jgi:hypothetical protein